MFKQIFIFLLSFSQQQLTYIGEPPPEKVNAEKAGGPDGPKSRGLVGDGMCSNAATMMNLFNTDAAVSMSSISSQHSQSANTACDGDVVPINTVTLAVDALKLADTGLDLPDIWQVTFPSPTLIKTILVENWDTTSTVAYKARIKTWITTVGNDSDVTKNTVCTSMGTMTASGWYMCPETLTGIYFAIYSTTKRVNIYEAMAFSQEAIQMNALQTNAVSGVASSPASNALKTLFSLLYDTSDPMNSSVIANPPAPGVCPYFELFLTAQVLIEGLVLLPAYLKVASNLPQIQKNVEVRFTDIISQVETVCGIFADYYTKYGEVKCSLPSYKVTLKQLTATNSLYFQGIGVLSNCDCALTSFNPALFYPLPPTTELISATELTRLFGDTTAKTITISTTIFDTVSRTCGTADGVTKCGSRTIKIFDSSNTQVTSQPYRGLSFDASLLTFAGSYQVVGSFTIDVEISLEAYPAVTYRQTITVSIVAVKCSVPSEMLNLLNTSAVVSQNAFYPGYSQVPSSGCDGNVLYTLDGVEDNSKVSKSNAPSPFWWRVEFLVQSTIRTFLIINTQSFAVKIQRVAATVGDSQDVTLNRQCKGFGQIIDGGWWPCDEALQGKIFGLFSNDDPVQFVEVMAFSQQAIQLNAVSATIKSEDSTYAASNALQNLVVTYGAGQKCIASTLTTDPLFTLTLKASVLIQGAILIPSEFSAWQSQQKDVAVFVEDTNGNQMQCGNKINDYNTYVEAYCGFVGIKVIVQKVGSNQMIALCGFGTLSDCDCQLTSFDPKLLPNAIDTFIQGNTTIHAVSSETTARNLTILSNQFDTVSSVCGLANGLTSCGQRTLKFVDRLTGQKITEWPYKGFQWKQPTLSFTPNQATQTVTVLTVSLVLVQYPNVTREQDITAITLDPKAAQKIREATLNAEIGTMSYLALPQLPSQLQYKVVQSYNFTIEVDGNVLSLLSDSDSDVGVKSVLIQAIDSVGKVIYSGALQVIFVKSKALQTKNAFSEIAEQLLLKKQTSCADCEEIKPQSDPPVMTVTKVNNRGFFSLKFNQTMNFTSLYPPKNDSDLRNLKGSSLIGDELSLAWDQRGTKTKYLLSARHLLIEIISGGYVNSSMLEFEWETLFINETQIDMQLFFVHPVWVSSQKGDPEVMNITLLKPSEDAFRSLDNGSKIIDPLQSVIKVLPPQVKLSTATQALQQISEIANTGGKTAIILNVFVALLLSMSLTRIWTMVNGLQIMLTFPLMNVVMPANTYILLSQLHSLNSFDVLNAKFILKSMFSFSDTDSPGFGFEQMGVASSRLILYLEMIFLLALGYVVMIIVYAVLWLLRRQWRPINRLRLKFGRTLFWQFLIRLLIQGCLDFATGILLSFQDCIFKTPSDIFDFILTLGFTPIIFGLPFASCWYLKRNVNLFSNEKFAKMFGALWQGYKTATEKERQTAITMVTQFISRRLLLAGIVSGLRQQTIWLQLVSNLLLVLVDVWIKHEYDPFESRVGGVCEKYNDCICLVVSYFMFLFTDFVSDPETKYMIGWGIIGLVGLMLIPNFLIISVKNVLKIASRVKRYLAIKHNKYVMEMKGIKLRGEKSTRRKIMEFLQIADLVYRDAAYGSESEWSEEEQPTTNKVANLEIQLANQTPVRGKREQIVEGGKRPKYTTLSGDMLVERKKQRIEKVLAILPSLDLDVEGALDHFVDLLPSDFSEHSPKTRKNDVKFMADLYLKESSSSSIEPLEESKKDVDKNELQTSQLLVVSVLVQKDVAAEMFTKVRPAKHALIFDAEPSFVQRDDFDL